MYVLDSQQFGLVYADLMVQNGKISVYGKRPVSLSGGYVPTPTLLDFSTIPYSLRNEIRERIKKQCLPAEPMSAELKKFCNGVWKKAATHYFGYGMK